MDDLEQARITWIEEKPKYEELVSFLENQLKSIIRDPDIQVYGRAKDIDSLVKKLIRKQDKTYESLTDKVGIRVVVKFNDQVDKVGELIEHRFPESHKEDKRKALIKNEQVGYQGIHYDIKLDETETDGTEFIGMSAEIQVRTLAQHLWADMSHGLGYKSELSITEENSRRLLRLSALVEVADDEFLRVRNEIGEMPEFSAITTLEVLQKEFYQFAATEYDKELSIITINQLNSLYGPDGLLAMKDEFKKFCEDNVKLLLHIFDDNRPLQIRPVFLFQPESLMIFHLLELDKFRLRQKWEEIYPFNELEQLAIRWGKPYKAD